MDDKLTLNELRVLSSLLYDEKYGLEIMKTIKEDTGKDIFIGTLYNLLYRMETKDYVRSRWGETESSRGGNRRKYYRLTGLGEKVVRNELSSLATVISSINLKPTTA